MQETADVQEVQSFGRRCWAGSCVRVGGTELPWGCLCADSTVLGAAELLPCPALLPGCQVEEPPGVDLLVLCREKEGKVRVVNLKLKQKTLGFQAFCCSLGRERKSLSAQQQVMSPCHDSLVHGCGKAPAVAPFCCCVQETLHRRAGMQFWEGLAVILVKVLGTVSLGRDKCCPCR